MVHLALFVFLPILLVGCSNDTSDSATIPALQPDAGSFSSPDECLRAYYSAIKNNNAAAFNHASIFLTDAYRDSFFDANIATDLAFKKLNKSMIGQFGESVKTLPVPNDTLLEKLQTIPVETIDPGKAVWKHGGAKSLELVKIDGSWKVDLRSMEEMFPSLTTFDPLQKIATQITAIAADVDSQAITNQDGVRSALSNLK